MVARHEPCVRGAQNNSANGDAPCCTPVAGRDVVPNVPDHFGGPAFERLGRTRREGREGKPDHSSFARREKEKWDAEDSVPPGPNCVATRCVHSPKPKPRWGFVFLIPSLRVACSSPVLRGSGPRQSEADLEATAEGGQPWALLQNPVGIQGRALFQT